MVFLTSSGSPRVAEEVFTYAVEPGAVASWLVRSTPEQGIRVRALAGDIALGS